MKEYKSLKKALKNYLECNEDLLQKAHDDSDFEEVEKRERRVKAALECRSILEGAK